MITRKISAKLYPVQREPEQNSQLLRATGSRDKNLTAPFIFTVFQANSLADPSFPCPLCGAAVGDEVTPVECTVALEVT